MNDQNQAENIYKQRNYTTQKLPNSSTSSSKIEDKVKSNTKLYKPRTVGSIIVFSDLTVINSHSHMCIPLSVYRGI